MEIATIDPALPFTLKQTKPRGVTVEFKNPAFNRMHDAETVVAVFMTIKVAANIDVAAVAIWLFEKLKGEDRTKTKTTYQKTNVEISLKGISIVLEKMTHSEGKND